MVGLCRNGAAFVERDCCKVVSTLLKRSSEYRLQSGFYYAGKSPTEVGTLNAVNGDNLIIAKMSVTHRLRTSRPRSQQTGVVDSGWGQLYSRALNKESISLAN